MLNARNVADNATKDFDLNVHFQEHHLDPPSTDDMEQLDVEVPADAKIEFLFPRFSDPPLKENGVMHVISANTQWMEFADVNAHPYAHHSDPPEVSTNNVDIAVNKTAMNGNLNKHLHAHHSDPPMVDVKIVAKYVTRNLDIHFDKHHSDPPERVEVKQFSNLTNPCTALAMGYGCLPYLVPSWTEIIWLFKLLMCMNCYCTPRILFHTWRIKFGMIQIPKMIQLPIDDGEKNDLMVSFMKIILSPNEDEKTMVIRKMKALMCLRIWKMLTSLTRKLSQAPAQERNGSSHKNWTFNLFIYIY